MGSAELSMVPHPWVLMHEPRWAFVLGRVFGSACTCSFWILGNCGMIDKKPGDECTIYMMCFPVNNDVKILFVFVVMLDVRACTWHVRFYI